MVIRNLKSSVLISAGFWFILLLFSVFCLTTYLNITRIKDSLNEIINITFPTVESGDDLIITLHDSSNLVRLSLFSKSIDELNLIENRFYDIIKFNRKAVKRLYIIASRDQILEKTA